MATPRYGFSSVQRRTSERSARHSAQVDFKPGYEIALESCELIVREEVPGACEHEGAWWLREQVISLGDVDFDATAEQRGVFSRAGSALVRLTYKERVRNRYREIEAAYEEIVARSRQRLGWGEDAASYLKLADLFGETALFGQQVSTYCSGGKSVYRTDDSAVVFIPTSDAEDLVATLDGYNSRACGE